MPTPEQFAAFREFCKERGCPKRPKGYTEFVQKYFELRDPSRPDMELKTYVLEFFAEHPEAPAKFLEYETVRNKLAVEFAQIINRPAEEAKEVNPSETNDESSGEAPS